jgi:Short C-terminal domain
VGDAGTDKILRDEDPQIRDAVGHLNSLLVPGERLEAFAVQRRIFALLNRRTLVAATSGRLIVMTRGLIGGFQPRDIRWQDLKEARVDVGIISTTLSLSAVGGADLAIAGQSIGTTTVTGLRKDQAQAVYRICQAQEQAWREKRRIRELEELRARSGGIQLGTQTVTGGSANVGESEDPAVRLQRAKDMHDKGLITDAEYETLRAKIVANI